MDIREITALKGIPAAIRAATHYSQGRLYTGSCADSSIYSGERWKFVEKAQDKFIEDHMKEILELAAQMAETQIKEIVDILTKAGTP